MPLWLQAAGEKILTVVCGYAIKISSDFSDFLETLNVVLERMMSGDFICTTG